MVIAMDINYTDTKAFKIGEIKEYIDNNYCNPELNVNMVSNEFGISLGYMSRCFKKEFSVGMADYICHLRINAAKRRLVNSIVTINEISYMVGFYSPNVFARSFKKLEGITPKDYRDKVRCSKIRA